MHKPLFELRILGHTELHGPVPEGPESLLRQSKRLALLAYLAMATAEGFRRRDQVIAYFWPELDQAQARTYLRKALYGIRESLGQEVFLTRGEDEVRVDPSLVWCDAVALSQHVKEGQWSEALALYHGELLEGLFPEGVAQEFQDWLSGQRKQLRERAAQAAWECSRLEEERGDRTAAAVMARRARELDPDNEEGVRRLMGLLDRRGDRGSALRVYQEWQARLLEEFGVEPAPETRKLARQVQAARKGESHETSPVESPVTRVRVRGAPADEPAPHPHPTDDTFAGNRTPWRPMAGAAGLVAVLALGSYSVVRSRALPEGGPRSVAVLPLRTIGDTGLEGTADVITEELMTVLVQQESLTVRQGNSPQTPVTDLAALGRELGTAFILDGGVQGGQGRVRVTLRLIRARDAIAIWAGSADVDSGTLTSRAQRIAAEVAAALLGRAP